MLDHSCQVQRAPLKEHRGDCYDTPPVAVSALLKVESLPKRIWEPACGTGNIVKALRDAGHHVIATDLNDRGCPNSLSRVDFLFCGRPYWPHCGCGTQSGPHACECGYDAIVTNPPFALAEKFVARAIQDAPYVAMLLRLAFYESDRRSHILDSAGLARIHVFANRLPMMHRAGWEGRKANSGMAFAWFVWERGHLGPALIDRIYWEGGDGAVGAGKDRAASQAD
jgi:hypothetical protein